MPSAGGVSQRQPQSFKPLGEKPKTIAEEKAGEGKMVMTELKIDNDALTTAGAEGAQAPQMPLFPNHTLVLCTRIFFFP